MFRNPMTTASSLTVVVSLFAWGVPAQTIADNPAVNSAISSQIEQLSRQPQPVIVAPSAASGSTVAQSNIVVVPAALRYFGFVDGDSDAVSQSAIRAAVSAYQQYQGYPVTGSLDPAEREFLTSSFAKARREGALTNRRIVRHADGVAGLLQIYTEQDARLAELLAIPPSSVSVEVTAPVIAPLTPADTQIESAAPIDVAGNIAERLGDVVNVRAELPDADPQTAIRTMPVVKEVVQVVVANGLEAHCNDLHLSAASAAAGEAEADAKLGQMFCVARTYAISKGLELSANATKDTVDGTARTCAALSQAMSSYVAELPQATPKDLMAQVAYFGENSGQDAQALRDASKMCLSAAYQNEDMTAAVGMGLLLTSLGETPYGELVGHHLMQGRGTDASVDQATGWYNLAVNAVADGATPVFAAGQAGRIASLETLVDKTRAVKNGVQVKAVTED